MRTITFRNLAPGHWVNPETGVELARGTHRDDTGKLRWYVFQPDRQDPAGRTVKAVRSSLADARRYARMEVVPEVRKVIAAAYALAHAPAAPQPPQGGAAELLVFRPCAVISAPAGVTWYTSEDGRYTIIGRPVAGVMGSAGNPDRAFTPYRGNVAVGPAHRRLKDAREAAQRDWRDLSKAEVSARLMERARLAGDAQWADATDGQVMLALAEDARRDGARRRAGGGAGPRQLSGWGQLRAAHRAGAAL